MPELDQIDVPDDSEIAALLRSYQQEEGAEARLAGLSASQLDVLARKVYLLLRRELVIERERRGWDTSW